MSDDFIEGCCIGCTCYMCLSNSKNGNNDSDNLGCCCALLGFGIFFVLPIILIGLYGPIYDNLDPKTYCKIQAPIANISFYNKIDAIVVISNQNFDVKNCTFAINDISCVTHDNVVKLLHNIVDERNASHDKFLAGIVLISIFVIFIVGFSCYELFSCYEHANRKWSSSTVHNSSL